MPKRIINTEGLNMNSVKAIVNSLGRLIGDEVYIRPVLEIESSEHVLKALDAVLEGLNKRTKKPANAPT